MGIGGGELASYTDTGCGVTSSDDFLFLELVNANIADHPGPRIKPRRNPAEISYSHLAYKVPWPAIKYRNYHRTGILRGELRKAQDIRNERYRKTN